MEDEEETEPKIRESLTKVLIIAMLVSYMGSFQYGYISITIHNPILFQVYNVSKEELIKNQGFFRSNISPTVICYFIGALSGILLFKLLVDKIGRRPLLLLSNVIALFTSAFMSICTIIASMTFVLLAYLTAGTCSGLFSCCVSIYLIEMSPTHRRGSITSAAYAAFVSGTFVARTLGVPQLLGNKKGFPILAVISIVLALLNMLLLLLSPESPRFIYIQKKNETKATQVLRKLRGKEDVDEEVQDLIEEDLYEDTNGTKNMTVWLLLRSPNQRWQLITVIILMVATQLSGASGMIFHIGRVFQTMALSKLMTTIIAISMTAFLILVTLITINVIDSMGRRFFIITGFMICSMTSVLLTFTLEFQVTHRVLAHASFGFILSFLSGYIMGPALMQDLILGELFLQSSRASASAVANCVTWFFRILSGIIHTQLEALLGPYCLLIYWVPCVTTFIYLFKTLPETKGKSFLEIQKIVTASSAKQKKKKGHKEKI